MEIDLERSALVVAHPDDEAIFFGGVFAQVATVIVCYLDDPANARLGRERRALMADYPCPLDIRSLGIAQAGAWRANRGHPPRPGPHGLRLARPLAAYDTNYRRLEQRLAVELRGFDCVFTHNPWGEYGHPDHAQVFRAVDAIRGRQGFELLVDDYRTRYTDDLREQLLPGFTDDVLDVAIDHALCETVRDAYIARGIWTWMAEYRWPAHELLLRRDPAAC